MYVDLNRTIHQKIEALLRHQIIVVAVLSLLVVALARFDSHFNSVLQQTYTQGIGWIGTSMKHEHPKHGDIHMAIVRVPTLSGTI